MLYLLIGLIDLEPPYNLGCLGLLLKAGTEGHHHQGSNIHHGYIGILVYLGHLDICAVSTMKVIHSDILSLH